MAKFCPKCGTEIKEGENFCSNCGNTEESTEQVNTTVTNTKPAGKGIAQIFVTLFTCGFGAIWGLIEGIMILSSNDYKDADGNTLRD